MSYLYGDSTPSSLEVNYIEFLRDAVEFCVQVLLADQGIVEGRAQVRALEQASAAEIVKLQKAGALVPKAFEGVTFGEAESAAARCVKAIVGTAAELVRATAAEVRSTLDGEINKRDADAARAREACVKALEVLLLKHDLPEMTSDLHVALVGGARYVCRAHVKTEFGLNAVVDLDVPASHLFERVVRVDRLAERLDVQAPELGGWLHKEVKLRPQHLDKHHLAELSIVGADLTLKLRLAPDGTGPGFDLLFSADGEPVRLVRVDEHGKRDEPPFEVQEADTPKLLAVREKLANAAADLTQHRKAVADAKLDGEPLGTHAEPAVVVKRLISVLAPVVQEIAARSQSPGELVLRRLLSGDRREEIFLSKQELKVKVAPLLEANRALFDPLWVDAAPGASSPSDRPALATPPRVDRVARAGGLAPAELPRSMEPRPAVEVRATTEPPRVEPPRVEPPRVEPLREEPPRVEPPRAEPLRVEPPRAEPPRAEPSRTESALQRSVEAALAGASPSPATPSSPTAAAPSWEPPPARPIPPRLPTPKLGMPPLAAIVPSSSVVGPPPPPPAARVETWGPIELGKQTPASILDRPPPPPSTGEVEITLEPDSSGPSTTRH